jgi:dihydroorotate dehydrogenase
VSRRYGFNSQGHEAVAENLKRHRPDAGYVGVNLGKNKTSQDAVDDYVRGVKALGRHADYIVINVSRWEFVMSDDSK